MAEYEPGKKTTGKLRRPCEVSTRPVEGSVRHNHARSNSNWRAWTVLA